MDKCIYPNVKRPCYYAVKNALKSTKLSVEFSKVLWHPEEEMVCTAWLLNDSEIAVKKGKAVVSVIFGGTASLVMEWDYPETPAYTNSNSSQFQLKIPKCKDGRFTLLICSETENELSDRYELFIN